MLDRVSQLNAEYARAIDDDRLEDWPGFFTDPCLYSITSADNHRRGLPAGVMGNSEVGHLTLGAGRMIPQDLLRIDLALREVALRLAGRMDLDVPALPARAAWHRPDRADLDGRAPQRLQALGEHIGQLGHDPDRRSRPGARQFCG